ncbi:PIN domain-containing protein [Paenibacillus alkaliterrae]|uniref:PIN domain-containing protein n=1 Tax=Paenibacillus alkaliterrae TaxID=320909 RepID=UPI001F2621AE|nr:PIN domain-containing protein [Paenibacillus alkaliterrae]MCF2937982.1 PIN domain-containing protein [Paenibacillus alkaliterrae]
MKYILDTNIIIRFLANDHEEHSLAAYRLFEKVTRGQYSLILDHVVIAECVHVLKGKSYQLARDEIANLLIKLIEFTEVEADNKDTMIMALRYYSAYNVDYPDAYLASLAEQQRLSVITFNNKDFNTMGTNNIKPSEL